MFGWGKNSFGQLGLNSEVDHIYPAQLKTLRSIRVKYIACGEDFSVFLTQVRDNFVRLFFLIKTYCSKDSFIIFYKSIENGVKHNCTVNLEKPFA